MKRNAIVVSIVVSLVAVAAYATTTRYKSIIGKQDIQIWDGVRDTFSRQTSTGGKITLDKVDWVGVDVSAVAGSRTNTALSNVVSQIGSAKASIFICPGSWTISADTTIPSNITTVVAPGASITVASGSTLTIYGPVNAGPYQTFYGSGDVAWTNGQPFYAEYWGGACDATDGSESSATDNATPFAKSIESLWLGGGGTLQLLGNGSQVSGSTYDGYAYYTSGSILDIDAETDGGLPDGTTATASSDIMPISIIGQSMSSTIVVTNSDINLIHVNGGDSGTNGLTSNVNVLGKINVRDLALVGASGSTGSGIYLENRVNRKNTFQRLRINGCAYGLRVESDAWGNYYSEMMIEHHEKWGLYIEREDQSQFIGIQVGYCDEGGIYIYNGHALTFEGITVNYSESPLIKIVASDSIAFRDLYIEPGSGATDDPWNFIELSANDDGTNATLSNIVFENVRVQPGQFSTVSNAADANLFYIVADGTGTGYVEGLELRNLRIGSIKDNCTGTVYVVNNDTSDPATLHACIYGPQAIAGKSVTYDAIFDSTTTERAFSSITDDQSDYTRIKTLLPFAYFFSAVNVSKNTSDNAMRHGGDDGTAGGAADQVDLPWIASLVAMSWDTNAATGAVITVHDTNSSFSDTITIATDSEHNKANYDLGDYVLTAGQKFEPKIDMNDNAAADGKDVYLTFYWAILIDGQD